FEKTRPDVVFSKGGYVSLPACLAAKKSGIPVVCHESDYTMGAANKLVSRFAAKTLTSFTSTPGDVCTGNPVREEIFFGSKEHAGLKYPLRPGKKTVLFCGGSQGAAAINKAVYAALPELTDKYNVLHVSGKSGDRSIADTDSYKQIEYASDFPDLLASADVVVGRAGANTLFEVAALGKPMLCIPLPKGTSRGDQLLNAEEFKKNGFVDILPQEDLFTESLLYKLDSVSRMKPPVLDASQTVKKIVKEILSVTK
ncbi:MAG: glycosyltransferase, partial [Clostridia bacterium]|nr:glycosyltransferase [Clostridia bacterium]